MPNPSTIERDDQQPTTRTYTYTPEQAILRAEFILVFCSSCCGTIPPPDTGILRHVWVITELERLTVCPSCGAENFVTNPKWDTTSLSGS